MLYSGFTAESVTVSSVLVLDAILRIFQYQKLNNINLQLYTVLSKIGVPWHQHPQMLRLCDVSHSLYGRRFWVNILYLPVFSCSPEQEICFAPFVCWTIAFTWWMAYICFHLVMSLLAKTTFLRDWTSRDIYGNWAIGHVMEPYRHKKERITSRQAQAACCTRLLTHHGEWH